MQESNQADRPISFGHRLSQLAAIHPEKIAVVFLSENGSQSRLSWAELDEAANRMARFLSNLGVNDTTMVVIGLPNSPEHLIGTFGTWKLGACVLPLSAKLPERERDELVKTANPRVLIADWSNAQGRQLSRSDFDQLMQFSGLPLPEKTPHPGKAMPSGGSTGRPKIIVDPTPWETTLTQLLDTYRPYSGIRTGQIQLVVGPFYHNAPFGWAHFGLFCGHTLVILERFEASRAVDAIEQFNINFMQLVPTTMQRIARLDGIDRRDFSSVEGCFHVGAPCPPWVKEKWIELVGPERLYEAYGTTENIGATLIRGDDWLQHKGSVGRAVNCEIRILDLDRNEVSPGEIGEIFMRPVNRAPTYQYLGSNPLESTPDGFASAGDLGWMDPEEFLYIADRRTDLIISGGANVFPAEIEGVLNQHPGLVDVVVIGLADPEWGRRVHALVEPLDHRAPPSAEELKRFCRQSLAAHKVPKTYEYLPELPRDEAGKIRRNQLVAERDSATK